MSPDDVPDVAPTSSDDYDELLQQTVQLALKQAVDGALPFAALVARQQTVLGWGTNTSVEDQDPSAHAEVVAIRHASQSGNELRDAVLITSGEPCGMCIALAVQVGVAAIIHAACRSDAANFGLAAQPHVEHVQAACRDASGLLVHRPVAAADAPFSAYALHRPRA